MTPDDEALFIALWCRVAPMVDWRWTRGTRAVSTDNRTLERWDTIITASPRHTCTGQMNPRTQQVEVTCR
jgi:hypothetical protein